MCPLESENGNGWMVAMCWTANGNLETRIYEPLICAARYITPGAGWQMPPAPVPYAGSSASSHRTELIGLLPRPASTVAPHLANELGQALINKHSRMLPVWGRMWSTHLASINEHVLSWTDNQLRRCIRSHSAVLEHPSTNDEPNACSQVIFSVLSVRCGAAERNFYNVLQDQRCSCPRLRPRPNKATWLRPRTRPQKMVLRQISVSQH